MSTSHRIGLVIVVAVAFALGNSFAGAQKGEPAKSVQKWELTKVDRGTAGWKEAQAMANEGWELVAVDISAFYLKRPK